METNNIIYKNINSEKVIVGADACHEVVDELALPVGYALAIVLEVTVNVPTPFRNLYMPFVIAEAQ